MRPPRRVVSLLVLTSLLTVGLVPLASATEVAAPDVLTDVLSLEGVATVDVAADRRAEVEDVLPEVREVELEMGLITGDEEPEQGRRTEVIEAPVAFTSLWAELPDGLDAVTVRTSADGRAWTDWTELEVLGEEDGPDAGTDEAAGTSASRATDPFFADQARYLQLEADATAPVEEIEIRLLDTEGLNESLVAKVARHLRPGVQPAEAATVPAGVHSRASWGAVHPKKAPTIASNGVQQIVLHHTAGQNFATNGTGCDTAAVARIIRNIQAFHMSPRSGAPNGWNDIGYNVIVDPCGGIWEGRAGGLDRAVVGAHAANFNTGSTGISVLGDFTKVAPNQNILRALDRVVGWKAGIHGIDTQGTVWRNSGSYPTVVGHRQVGSTACPGAIMNSISSIRTNAKAESSKWDRVPDGAGTTTAPRFTDVAGSPHAAAIEELVTREITTGYPDRTFRPGNDVTRAQVATFLSRALGLEPIPGARFKDVDAGFVHAGAINALVEAGILTGYAGNTFRPHEPLRREHMAVVITRALELDLNPVAAARFSDVVAYAGEIGAIADAKIASGRPDGTFQPKASVTRGQMATFLMNAVRFLEERDGDEEVPPEPEPTP